MVQSLFNDRDRAILWGSLDFIAVVTELRTGCRSKFFCVACLSYPQMNLIGEVPSRALKPISSLLERTDPTRPQFIRGWEECKVESCN
jgi:hypothetical protein